MEPENADAATFMAFLAAVLAMRRCPSRHDAGGEPASARDGRSRSTALGAVAAGLVQLRCSPRRRFARALVAARLHLVSTATPGLRAAALSRPSHPPICPQQNPCPARPASRAIRFRSPMHLRNIAIIAHVDHGKTTLVDELLEAVGRVPRRTSASPSAPWIPTTSRRSAASPSWPRRPRSSGRTRASTSSTPPATPISAARSSASWTWSTAPSCWSTPPKGRCRRPSSWSARR